VKKRKGQVIVEFAMILPLFLLIMYGIIYSGMMFHDYSTLSNIARAGAREAAISGETPTGEEKRYIVIENRYKEKLGNLLTSFYVPDTFVIKQVGTDGDGIEATINMKLTMRGYFIDMVIPPTFGVQYYMRKEPASS